MATMISESEFGYLLRSFRRSAFRLETRDMYALDYEAADFDQFLAGTPAPPPDVDWWRPWLDQIGSLTGQGKQIGRVRVLAEPPSDYQRWELWAAPWHSRAGEQISYLPRSKAREIHLPDDHDWWLLDDENLIVMQFDHEGRMDGKLLFTGTEMTEQHRAWRDLAVRNATPAEALAA